MPFTCEAIFACGDYENDTAQVGAIFGRTTQPPPVYFLISGATAGTRYETVCSANSYDQALYFPVSSATCGASIALSGYFVIPANLSLNGFSQSTGRFNHNSAGVVPNVPCVFNASILDNETAVFSITTAFASNTRQMGTWVVSKAVQAFM